MLEGRIREVRKDLGDCRWRAEAQVEAGRGRDPAARPRGAGVSAARMSGPERDRGGVAADEALHLGRAVRPVQLCAATSTSTGGWEHPDRNSTPRNTSTGRYRRVHGYRGSCACSAINGKQSIFAGPKESISWGKNNKRLRRDLPACLITRVKFGD